MLTLYRNRWGLFYLPVVAAAVLAIVAAAHWLFPLPPRSVVIAAGAPQDGFDRLADQYREELARRGIAADFVNQRLDSADGNAQAGFANGMLADRTGPATLHALAVIGKQPVWIFSRSSQVNSIAALRGLRVAAGPAGAPARKVAELLLSGAQMKPSDVEWSDAPDAAAATDLLEQRVDALVTIGSGDAPIVRSLSRSAGITMIGLDHADSLASREPRLQWFVLPQGAIELRGDVPSRDLAMLHAGTHLLVRGAMHPALQRALLDAATEIHSVPTFLQRQNEYPDWRTDFPLSPVAQRYAQGDRPWMESALPYWWAQLAELVLYAVLPVLFITGLALVWIPHFFSLRVDAVLAHYYGELGFLEEDVDTAIEQPIRIKQLVAKLDQMETEVTALDLPDRFADRWYTLRQHLVNVRDRLLALRAR